MPSEEGFCYKVLPKKSKKVEENNETKYLEQRFLLPPSRNLNQKYLWPVHVSKDYVNYSSSKKIVKG